MLGAGFVSPGRVPPLHSLDRKGRRAGLASDLRLFHKPPLVPPAPSPFRVGWGISHRADILHRPTPRLPWDGSERTTLGEAVKKTVRRNTGQGWTKPKIAGTIVLLVAAVIGTYFLPLHFLNVAGEANGHGDRATADFWEEWSLGLVVLGPTLFTTSFLAMASQLSKLSRVLVRIAAFALFAGVYSQLWGVGSKIHISVMLGIIGVIYTVCADAFTPDSSGKETIDAVPTEDDEPVEDDKSTETVAKPEKPVVAAVPASLKP